jgi:hypothetical protein
MMDHGCWYHTLLLSLSVALREQVEASVPILVTVVSLWTTIPLWSSFPSSFDIPQTSGGFMVLL